MPKPVSNVTPPNEGGKGELKTLWKQRSITSSFPAYF